MYTKNTRFVYDYIIIAIGAKQNYFGISGAKENCIKLKDIYNSNIIDTEINKINDKNKNKFVIIGAGATGIEIACEIKDRINQFKKNIDVVIIEGNNRILNPINNDKIRKYTLKTLLKKGIEIKFNSRVSKITNDHINLSNGEKIHTKNVFWAAGVKPNYIEVTPNIIDKSGHFPVDGYLMIKNIDNAYAIGDCALFNQSGIPLPDLAQIAQKQAKAVYKNLILNINEKRQKKFKYISNGFILSLGKFKGIAEVNGIIIKGFPAWLIHKAVYSIKRIGIKTKIKTFFKLLV